MKDLLISVIVPVYNVQDYISACIRSILSQNVNMELIIVDDGSTDGSMAIVREELSLAGREAKFVSYGGNRGVSAARNAGLLQAEGDYVFFMDSDDTLLPDSLQALSAPLGNYRYDMVIGDYLRAGEPRNLPLLNMEEGALLGNDAIVWSYLRKEWYQMVWNKLFRTDFLRDSRISFPEGAVHEDELFSAETACLLESMYVVKKETYRYYIRGNSIVTGSLYRKRAESFRVMAGLLETFMRERSIRYKYSSVRICRRFFNVAMGCAIQQGREAALEEYRALRTALPRNWFILAAVSSFRIKEMKRNMHYLLPMEAGARYYLKNNS